MYLTLPLSCIWSILISVVVGTFLKLRTVTKKNIKLNFHLIL